MTLIPHPSAMKAASAHLGRSSVELRAALAELRESIGGSALDDEFKATMIEGLDRWIASLDRLIPHFRGNSGSANAHETFGTPAFPPQQIAIARRWLAEPDLHQLTYVEIRACQALIDFCDTGLPMSDEDFGEAAHLLGLAAWGRSNKRDPVA